MALDDTGTLLVFRPLSGSAGPILSPWSARGLEQTLELPSGLKKRTINGVLRTLANIATTRKYISTVTCKDQEIPCLDDTWDGVIVEVDCVHELKRANGAPAVRPVVAGSERDMGDGIIAYRPTLVMMIDGISSTREEWQAEYSWQIKLVEV